MSEKQIEYAADFWNCDCAGGWIHATTVNDCPRCGKVASESENSSVDEVALVIGMPRDEIRRLPA